MLVSRKTEKSAGKWKGTLVRSQLSFVGRIIAIHDDGFTLLAKDAVYGCTFPETVDVIPRVDDVVRVTGRIHYTPKQFQPEIPFTTKTVKIIPQ